MSDPMKRLSMGDVIRARVADCQLRVFAHQFANDPRSDRFIPPREIASRRELRDLLRISGLSRAHAERAASYGWGGLNPDDATAKQARALAERMKSLRL